MLGGPFSTGLPPAGIAVLRDAENTAVGEEMVQILPQQAILSPAYPNPFNALTTIPFVLESNRVQTRLAVYDSLGRRVRVLAQGPLEAGRHVYSWDGRNEVGRTVGNGTYLIQLHLGQDQLTSKVMLLK